jgi:hypothetical protein
VAKFKFNGKFGVLYFDVFCIFCFSCGAGRTRPNTRPNIHIGIDLLFADVPENLRLPSISA